MSGTARRAPPPADNYWPAFVDALTNVVLNLLFLVAVFVVALFALGLQAGKATRAMHEALAASAAAPPVRPETAPAPVQAADDRSEDGDRDSDVPPAAPLSHPKVFAVHAVAPAGDPGEISLRTERLINGRTLVVASFAADALVVPASERDALQAQMRLLIGDAQDRTWMVWSNAALSDPVARRSAYLRNMAVRELLTAAGVPADDVRIEMVDGAASLPGTAEVYASVLQRDTAAASSPHDSD